MPAGSSPAAAASGPLGGSGILGANKVIDGLPQGAARSRGARHSVPDRQPRRIGGRIGIDLARGRCGRKAAGKPVIVSMGDVAGSGGYYIAAGADKIVAEPATLTGSIGVLAGKMLITGLCRQARHELGFGANRQQRGDVQPDRGFHSKDGHARFESFLDEVYAGFKERVAEGRKLDAAAVENVAKGRVWTGEEAKARGLVDALGRLSRPRSISPSRRRAFPRTSDVTLEALPAAERHGARAASPALLGGGEDEDATDGGCLVPSPRRWRCCSRWSQQLRAPGVAAGRAGDAAAR